MSKSWNEKELQLASEQMKKMGYMSYKEFCKHLNQHPITITETAISEAVIKEYKQKQLDGVKMPCPRCGADRMRVPATYNALSRQADIYVCDICGMEEAIYAAKGNQLPMKYWDLYARLE